MNSSSHNYYLIKYIKKSINIRKNRKVKEEKIIFFLIYMRHIYNELNCIKIHVYTRGETYKDRSPYIEVNIISIIGSSTQGG